MAGLSVLCTLGCRQPVAPADAAGLYVRRASAHADSLWVRPTGRWERHQWDANSRHVADSGRWTRDSLNGDFAITFENFGWRRSLPPDFSRPADVRGFWVVAPQRRLFGDIVLVVDADVGDAFQQASRFP